MTLRSIGNGPTLVNYVCAVYFFSTAQKEELLAIDSLTERATAVLTLLEKENEMMNIKADIRRRTHEAMDKQLMIERGKTKRSLKKTKRS